MSARLATDPPLMTTDRQKVKQIVVNLLTNALKFTHQGGVEIGVEFEGDRRAASVAVSDTGIGIAPENHEKIFEDFRQVDDSPTRQYGGTGLGLSISYGIVRRFGGDLRVESAVGRGTTVRVTLPVAR